MLENAERISHNISRIQSQINDSETFFNNISKVNRNDMKLVEKTFKNGDIVYSHVYHKYKDDFVLENVNLTIQKGENVAFVGQIGSGKSTMIKLLLGFQPLRMGHITIGGVDVNEISNKDLRKYIFYIPQKPKLFNRTLYENIVYGLKNPPTRDAIIKLLGELELNDLQIEFGEKMDVPVGVEGNKLSGGQKQRIAIARALLYNPEILLLDEATSALDTESEEQILLNVQNFLAGKTIISVAHRISSIEKADEILVINQGALVSQGSHTQLLHNSKIYNVLYKEQK
jgi:ABC-type multidrug transport system fused ATPase/permease subunit